MEALRIGTRRSALARWQAEHIATLLRSVHPGLEVVIVPMSTKGDRFLGAPLAEIGGKGLFVQEIEQALLRGEVDLAVHSLKDLPAEVPDKLVLARPPPREDPRDALVSRVGSSIGDLPRGARVGTSSLRRAVQIRALRSDLEIVPIRGNVQTRLSRTLGPGDELLDAVVVALAGLKRLGLDESVTEILDPADVVPAVGQGILAIEHRRDDARTSEALAPLGDRDADLAARAERSLLCRLGAGCHVPLGGYARVGETLTLSAVLGDPETGRLYRIETKGPPLDGERIGRAAAEILLASEGARALGQPLPRTTPEA